jgi:L-arabinokinase
LTAVFYVSGHGFGHATRTFTVIDRLHQREPALRLALRSTLPQWFVGRSTASPIEYSVVEVDTGMAQLDSLRIDVDDSARRAARFYASFDERADEEARLLRALGAAVVIGDIPPLAFEAASRAGVPSIACANFTWDWIYGAYPQFDALAPGVLARIAAAYGRASHALRLPFHGGFGPMAGVVRDVPLVARRSRRGRADARRALGLTDGRPAVLVSFGGHGAKLPLADIAARGQLTLLVTGHEVGRHAASPALRHLTWDELDARELRYEDLVAASDVVISKPGYGIVSECIANETPLLYTSRGHFIEHDVLVRGMTPLLKTAFLSNDELRAGNWERAVTGLLAAAAPSQHVDIGGAEVVADAILQLRRL